MSTTNLNAHFGQYLALLKTLYPGISGLTVFDRDASLIWQDCDNPVDQEQLHSLAHKMLRSGIDSQIQHLLNGDIAELIKLKTPNGEATLVLSICGGGLAQHARLGLDAADAPSENAQTVDHGGVGVRAD